MKECGDNGCFRLVCNGFCTIPTPPNATLRVCLVADPRVRKCPRPSPRGQTAAWPPEVCGGCPRKVFLPSLFVVPLPRHRKDPFLCLAFSCVPIERLPMQINCRMNLSYKCKEEKLFSRPKSRPKKLFPPEGLSFRTILAFMPEPCKCQFSIGSEPIDEVHGKLNAKCRKGALT